MINQINVIDDELEQENGMYDDMTDELYAQLNEIIELNERYQFYKVHPNAKVIKQIIDALDKAGWFSPSQLKKALKKG